MSAWEQWTVHPHPLDYKTLVRFRTRKNGVVHQTSPVPGYQDGAWCGTYGWAGEALTTSDKTTCKRCLKYRKRWIQDPSVPHGWRHVNGYKKDN
jgi:hypothetical protein